MSVDVLKELCEAGARYVTRLQGALDMRWRIYCYYALNPTRGTPEVLEWVSANLTRVQRRLNEVEEALRHLQDAYQRAAAKAALLAA